MSGTRKILSYAFLMGVGCTMLVPFLWMCSSALKPEGQIFRDNWIPTNEYVSVEGVKYVLDKKHEAADGAGTYRVQLLEGPSEGEERTISTALMRAGRQRGVFVYVPSHDDIPVRIEVLEKISPIYYLVSGKALKGEALLVEHRVAEFDIIERPALQWSDFKRAIEVSGVFGRAYINTLLVAILITVGQVFTSSLAAYAFSRLRFPFRDTLFLAYLATMMIPAAVTMIPVFIILKSLPEILNWVFNTNWFLQDLYFVASELKWYYVGKPIGLDSYFALIVPGLFSAYGTFLLRQFFMSLPRDLEDAARIDGCGTWGIYCNVILPLSKPALATLTIFTFMGAWRAFLWPLVVTSTPEMQVLPVMLQAFMGVTGTQWNLLMAGTLLVLAPMIIVFVFGQRYFVEGIQLGAVKG